MIIYMKTLTFLLLFGTSIFASDLTDLQSKYNKAAAKALEPINKVYTEELQKLLQKYSKEGNLDEVTKITDELKKINTDSDKKPDTHLFVGRPWVSGASAEYVFFKDGKGQRSYFGTVTPFTWELLPNSTVKVNGTMNSAPKVWFFSFKNLREATFGDIPTDINNPLGRK